MKINLAEDLSAPNEVIVNINVNKNDKLKVHKIYIDGNEVLSDNQVQRAMKKTNEKRQAPQPLPSEKVCRERL